MILIVICLLLVHHHSTASVIRVFQYSSTAPQTAIAIVYQQIEADRRISCIIKCAGDPNCSSASFEVCTSYNLLGSLVFHCFFHSCYMTHTLFRNFSHKYCLKGGSVPEMHEFYFFLTSRYCYNLNLKYVYLK